MDGENPQACRSLHVQAISAAVLLVSVSQDLAPNHPCRVQVRDTGRDVRIMEILIALPDTCTRRT